MGRHGAIAAAPVSDAGALYARLTARRDEHEQIIRMQFPGVFDEADAEDLVSAAFERVLTTSALPAPDAERAWFTRVVNNIAHDELRRRRGRKGGEDKRGGGLRNVIRLSVYAQRGKELSSEDLLTDPERVLELMDEPADRERASDQAYVALDGLEDEDARLLRIRHFELPDASRARCAAAAGLTVEAWRHRYKRAWGRFVDELASAEPTEHCRPTRALIGELDAGAVRMSEARAARARVDVHVLECTACRVFARDSYRILVLTPTVPAGAGVLERVAEQGAAVAGRHGEAVAGSAAGGGVGLLATLGAALGGGGLKTLAIVCTLSATTAGLCGGIVATIDLLNDPPRAPETRVAKTPPQQQRSRPTPTPTPRRTAVPTRTAEPEPKPRVAKPTPTPDVSEPPPAPASTGSTGNEFDPIAVGSQSQPAQAPSGGSEFTP